MKKSIKKILITHSSNDNYGASKILISIIDILIKNGYDIYLILPYKGPLNNNEIIKRTNLNVIDLGVFRKKYFTIFGLINRLYFIIKSTLYIKSFIKINQIDLVYVNTSTLISPSVAAKFVGIPSIHHIHEIPIGNFFYTKFIAIFLNNFSRDIICVSKSVKEFWTQKGVNKNKLEIIYNGFIFEKPKQKNINSEKIIFTSISRIIPYKGHNLLIELFEILCKKNNNIYLQIVGDTLPYYEKYLNKLKLDVKEKHLENKICFTGFRNDVISILESSSFFIHTPVLPDPFPTVIFEAIKSKTPIITNNLGGAYEILNNGRNGLIIKNNFIHESAKKILKYIKEKELYLRNNDNAFNFVSKNFTIQKFEKKLLKIIE